VRRTATLSLVIGLLTAIVTWWTWGAAVPMPVVQDEYSYLLQAKIFARGEWTGPSPPSPVSFQQPHVLTTPRLASKYPPGHALLLSLGARLNVPYLVPLVLSAISGALVVLLVEPVGGPFLAIVCWLMWLGDPINLRFRPGYYSEVTSGAAWLASWWLLRRWRASTSVGWLCALAMALGWMAITRPLSALAFAVPLGIYVSARAIRERRANQLVPAFVIGGAVVSILLVWNAKTTGSLRTSPLALYRQQYLPFDKPGFGLDSTPPSMPLSSVNADVYAEFAREHAGYTASHLPVAAFQRLRALALAEWSGWRVALVPFVVVGLATATAELWFATACGAALFLAYLSYAHWPGWTLYYFEALPIPAFCAAAGVMWLARRLERWHTIARELALAGFTLLIVITATSVTAWRNRHIADASYDHTFNAALAKLPFRGAVVFVRYNPAQHPHATVVRNSPTLQTDRLWVVNDDPPNNRTVLNAARGRVPLLFTEADGRIVIYDSLMPPPR
jgi:hypothetical protein